MNEQSTSPEIDLKEILRPITNLWQRATKGLLFYWHRLTRVKWWIIAFTGIVAVAAMAIRPLVPKYYSTKAVLVSNTLDASFCTSMLETLAEFAKDERNEVVLSRSLDIPIEAAQSIHKMSTEVLEDTLRMKNQDSFLAVFKVSLVVTDNKYILPIQAGILKYLESNDYAVKRKKARIRTLELQNSSYENRLKSLDSLKDIVNGSIQPRSSGNGIILGEPIDPINVYRAQDGFYKELLKNQEEIAMSDNVEIIQPFLEPAYFNYPNITRLISIIVLASFLFAVLVFPFVRLGRLRSK